MSEDMARAWADIRDGVDAMLAELRTVTEERDSLVAWSRALDADCLLGCLASPLRDQVVDLQRSHDRLAVAARAILAYVASPSKAHVDCSCPFCDLQRALGPASEKVSNAEPAGIPITDSSSGGAA